MQRTNNSNQFETQNSIPQNESKVKNYNTQNRDNIFVEELQKAVSKSKNNLSTIVEISSIENEILDDETNSKNNAKFSNENYNNKIIFDKTEPNEINNDDDQITTLGLSRFNYILNIKYFKFNFIWY
jgi:hypothetical protein